MLGSNPGSLPEMLSSACLRVGGWVGLLLYVSVCM